MVSNVATSWTAYTLTSLKRSIVNHNHLPGNLRGFGITSILLKLNSSYLEDWRLTARLNGAASFSFPVTSGLPHVARTAPLYFSVFVNGIAAAYLCRRCQGLKDNKVSKRVIITPTLSPALTCDIICSRTNYLLSSIVRVIRDRFSIDMLRTLYVQLVLSSCTALQCG